MSSFRSRAVLFLTSAVLFLFALGALTGNLPAQSAPAGANTSRDPGQEMNQALAQTNAGPARSFDDVLDRAMNREHLLANQLRDKQPVIETYIQEVKKSGDLGYVPIHDFYFLGKLNISNGVVDQSFLPGKSMAKRVPAVFTSMFSTDYHPGGFADEMFVDPRGLDRAHYAFDFLRREFLGEVRCLVVDVRPRRGSGKGRFEGRIWIEDRNYNIVRFNGRYIPSANNEFTHFETWRVNAGGMWLPAYIYSQEESYRWGPVHTAAMRGQTRLWDFKAVKDRSSQAFTDLTIDSPEVRDTAQDNANRVAPLQSERAWEQQAEDNVIERLQRAGLVAPSSDVDQVLNTVLNNLQLTNSINFDPPVQARILLTTPLESVALNHAVLVSRGLIDVLPDEASLAAVLAHELAHIVLGHPVDTRYSFADRLLFDDPEAVRDLDIKRTQEEETAADERAIAILKNSPYKDKLPRIGLFLRMLSDRSEDVPHLIKPLLGNRMADTKKDLRMSGLMDLAPELKVRDKTQISALPLGSRVVVDPWSDRLRLLKTQTVTLVSPREKLPFQVTPFNVYLTRESAAGIGGSATNSPTAERPPAQDNK